MNERLQKVLARMGYGSRREVEQWISAGRVKINDQIAQLGARVEEKDRIKVDGRLIQLDHTQKKPTRVIVYHKPAGEVCTREDEQGRKTVFDSVKFVRRKNWIMVGRLDIATTGLLLFTNDGDLANRLMHPSYQIEREYAVRIYGEVSDEVIQRLLDGVELEDGLAKFDTVTYSGGEGKNHWYHVTLKEGRNREVRRLWESQDVQVSRLTRIRFANVELPRSLPRGKTLELTEKQLLSLKALVY